VRFNVLVFLNGAPGTLEFRLTCPKLGSFLALYWCHLSPRKYIPSYHTSSSWITHVNRQLLPAKVCSDYKDKPPARLHIPISSLSAMSQTTSCDPADRFPDELFMIICEELEKSNCLRIKALQFHRYILVNRRWNSILTPFLFRSLLLFVDDNVLTSWVCPWCSPSRSKNNAVRHLAFYQKFKYMFRRKPKVLQYVRDFSLLYGTSPMPQRGSAAQQFIRTETLFINELMNSMRRLHSLQLLNHQHNNLFTSWMTGFCAPLALTRIASLVISMDLFSSHTLPLTPFLFPHIRSLTFSPYSCGTARNSDHDHQLLSDSISNWVGIMNSLEKLHISHHRVSLTSYPASITELYFSCSIREGTFSEAMKFYTIILALSNLTVLSLSAAPITALVTSNAFEMPVIACTKLKVIVLAEDELPKTDPIARRVVIGLLHQCTILSEFSYFGWALSNRFVLPSSLSILRHGHPPLQRHVESGRRRSTNELLLRRYANQGSEITRHYDSDGRRYSVKGEQRFHARTDVLSMMKLCNMISPVPNLRFLQLLADNCVFQGDNGCRILRPLLTVCPNLDRIRISHVDGDFQSRVINGLPSCAVVLQVEHQQCEINVRILRRVVPQLHCGPCTNWLGRC
jgi:hypothetical protein